MSEPVETESYLLTVLRYIYQNPFKVGMVNKAEDYQWSSYKQYYFVYQGQSFFISGDLIKAYFKTFKDFSYYISVINNDKCLEYNPVKRYNDNTLRKIIDNEYNIDNLIKIL